MFFLIVDRLVPQDVSLSGFNIEGKSIIGSKMLMGHAGATEVKYKKYQLLF